MSFESVVTGFVNDTLEKVANDIKVDMVDVVSKHSRSGNGVSAIRVEKVDGISYFIGAHINWKDHTNGGLHLYYLDQGNGGEKKVIHPKGTALGPLPPYKDHPGGYRAYVHGYDGIGFVKKIADKYRR